ECATSAKSATSPKPWRVMLANLAAVDPRILIYGIAGIAFVVVMLLGFGIYAAATAPQARLKRRISAVVGEPGPALALPGSGRRGAQSGAKRKKQIAERLRLAEEARQKRRGSRLREQLTYAGWDKVTPNQFILFSLVLGLVLAGFGFMVSMPWYLILAVAAIGAFGIPKFVLNFKIKRRLKRFIANFPDAIDIIVRGVRSGLTVGEC